MQRKLLQNEDFPVPQLLTSKRISQTHLHSMTASILGYVCFKIISVATDCFAAEWYINSAAYGNCDEEVISNEHTKLRGRFSAAN